MSSWATFCRRTDARGFTTTDCELCVSATVALVTFTVVSSGAPLLYWYVALTEMP